MCTHILHLNNRKLKTYRGNLSEFVKRVPEAKSYYELSAAVQTFNFPEPGFLEGVKTKDKAILKMTDVCFKYPGTEKYILNGVSIYVTLNSRVAVLGPNGAGKSTMIKVCGCWGGVRFVESVCCCAYCGQESMFCAVHQWGGVAVHQCLSLPHTHQSTDPLTPPTIRCSRVRSPPPVVQWSSTPTCVLHM